jgi:cytochrome c oxidase subunit 3
MSSSHAHAENKYLAHHFQSMEQQNESAMMGMWLFLAQEIMFFGGMFGAYAVYRYLDHDAWHAASQSLWWQLGAVNTTVLLLSSFTMVMAVYHTQVGNNRKVIRYLILTLLLGCTFVGLKLQFEYFPKFEHGMLPGAHWNPDPNDHHYAHVADFIANSADPVAASGATQRFYFLYFIMTGMHAFHMVIGFFLIFWLIWMAATNRVNAHRYMPVELFGLYWHFVDIVWIFLFPMFYLVT